MNKYKLITDSSCDLPQGYADENNISTTCLIITLGERVYRDRIDITPDELMNLSLSQNIIPKTSALNINDLSEVFKEHLKENEHIFYLPISSKVSGMYNIANMAVEQIGATDRVHVLDSKELSTGIAPLVYGLVEDFKRDLDVDTIIKNHYERAQRVYLSFVIDTFDYLYKGGRCSGMTYIMGNKLHLHPIIRLDDGKMAVRKLVRGKTIDKALDDMISTFKVNLDKGNVDLSYPIFIPNVTSPSGVKKMKKELTELVGDKILFPISASAIICCHAGPNTVGLSYMLKKPLD